MANIVTLCLSLTMLYSVVHGYSTGAPDTVCGDMLPRHPGVPQTIKAPYSISLDRNKINSNDIVQVTIRGNRNEKFKGFFVQGRVGGIPVGSFEKISGVNLVNCGKGVQTAATHVDPEEKQQVVLKWRAPKGLSESVYFNTTIVKDGLTYWVGLLSPQLQVSKGGN